MKPKQPQLVSIIMPAYNSAKFLAEAVDSVLSQTHRNFELLIVYDESTDCSLQIINDYCEADSRIRLLQGRKEGISGALNLAIENSLGEFIARMDSDDICEPDRIEKQIQFIEDQSLDICGSHSLLIDAFGKLQGIALSPLTHEACTFCLSFSVPFSHPTVMIRKKFLVEHNLRYGQSKFKAAEDYDLWVRMHRSGARLGNADDVLLRYRVLDDSLSRNNRAMLIDTKAIASIFFENYYDWNQTFLPEILQEGNSFEKFLAARFLWRTFFTKGNFSSLRSIRALGFRVAARGILVELARFLGYR